MAWIRCRQSFSLYTVLCHPEPRLADIATPAKSSTPWTSDTICLDPPGLTHLVLWVLGICALFFVIAWMHAAQDVCVDRFKLTSHLAARRSIGLMFIPLVTEVLGGLSRDTIDTICSLGQGIGRRTGVTNPAKHISQSLAIALWRGKILPCGYTMAKFFLLSLTV